MTAPNPTTSQHRPQGLLWRLLALLASAVAAGVASALLYLASPSLMPSTFSILAPAAIGVVAGLSGRWLLRGQGQLLRVAAVFAAVALSMTFLGWLGSGLLFSFYRPARPDWAALGLLALGFMTGWLALRAWSGPAAPIGQAAPAPPPRKPQEVRRARRPHSGKPTTEPQVTGPLKPPARSRRLNLPRFRRRRAHHINLVGKTEHRCPYCLEIIHRRDPRGVVVCPECKTPHHADCWAVTGMCQIPHQHS